MTTRLVSACVVILACLWVDCPLAAPPNPSVAVQSVPITRHTLAATLLAYGHVQPDPQAVTAITADGQAYVQTIEVSQGVQVLRGQPLLSLRSAPASRAQYQTAKAQMRFAEQALKRQRSLLAQQLATHADVEAAQNSLAGARAALDTQKALGNDQAIRTITAPFSGIVSALSISPGQQVNAGTRMLQLARSDQLQAVLSIPINRRTQIVRGAQVALSRVFNQSAGTAGPPPILATIGTVDAVVDPKSNQINARVPLDGAQTQDLLTGMAVTGRITLSTDTTLAVPRAAVLHDKQGDYVFVVTRHRAHRVTVQTGIHDHDLIGVTGRLRAGDRVVTEGNYELTDGGAIRTGS